MWPVDVPDGAAGRPRDRSSANATEVEVDGVLRVEASLRRNNLRRRTSRTGPRRAPFKVKYVPIRSSGSRNAPPRSDLGDTHSQDDGRSHVCQVPGRYARVGAWALRSQKLEVPRDVPMYRLR
jgi:hypothetical protein